MRIENCVITLIGLCLAVAGNLNASSFVVGGFNATRGGFESLAPGEDSALATDVASAFPGTTFEFTNTLTSPFLSGVNVLILGVATTDTSAITPLTGSEQTALHNFVLSGGTALIFSDNSTFDPNAPSANSSLLSPFGVTATGTLNGSVNAPILNATGPLTGPFKPVTQFATSYPGYYSNTAGGDVLADLNGNPSEAAIDYFSPGALATGSGAVVLFSDSDAMVAGDSLTTTNLHLILNAFSLTVPVPAPEPSTLAFVGIALGALTVIRNRKAT